MSKSIAPQDATYAGKKHFSLVARRRVGALLFFFASEKESTFKNKFININKGEL